MEQTPRSAVTLAPTLDTWSWQLRARCRSMDTEFFFPRVGEPHGARVRRERAAKTICSMCPVQENCREHALATGEYGVWGGTSDTDRRRTRPAPVLRKH
ncbi:WhiB family transcriptional regulator [Rhodococcus jostii]|nr:WhiB family transcriptional regulator [Rhodococcus jostii]